MPSGPPAEQFCGDGVGVDAFDALGDPTPVQQDGIDSLRFDWRIPVGQDVACNLAIDKKGDSQRYLTLHLTGKHRIHKFVCPDCGLALRPHSFPKHTAAKCPARDRPPILRHVKVVTKDQVEDAVSGERSSE